MKPFEDWLRERLEAAGCIGGEIEDDDLHAGIERFQQVRGLTVTGFADMETCWHLRQQRSTNPDSALTMFEIVPPTNGSVYAGVSA